MGTEKRVRTGQVKVRVSPEELETIAKIAAQCDLAPSTFLRQLGLRYKPKSTVDLQAFEKLAHLHGDLGRVGGLLKMWLADKAKSDYGHQLNIPELVDEIISLQKRIGEIAEKL